MTSSSVINLGSQVINLRSQVIKFRSQVNKLRSQLINLRSQVSKLRSQVNQMRSQVSKLRSRVISCDRKLLSCDEKHRYVPYEPPVPEALHLRLGMFFCRWTTFRRILLICTDVNRILWEKLLLFGINIVRINIKEVIKSGSSAAIFESCALLWFEYLI